VLKILIRKDRFFANAIKASTARSEGKGRLFSRNTIILKDFLNETQIVLSSLSKINDSF
jgi:hypothetical protein